MSGSYRVSPSRAQGGEQRSERVRHGKSPAATGGTTTATLEQKELVNGVAANARADRRCPRDAAMKAYYDGGFRGPIRPDHVPTVTGFEENRFPGYNDLGALFAIGYIKGLMEAAMKA